MTIEKAVADIQIQSMMFDMAIDWETFELIPKAKKDTTPIWIKKWRDNREASDFDEQFDIDQEREIYG